MQLYQPPFVCIQENVLEYFHTQRGVEGNQISSTLPYSYLIIIYRVLLLMYVAL